LIVLHGVVGSGLFYVPRAILFGSKLGAISGGHSCLNQIFWFGFLVLLTNLVFENNKQNMPENLGNRRFC
jgi:hypothetical protein